MLLRAGDEGLVHEGKLRGRERDFGAGAGAAVDFGGGSGLCGAGCEEDLEVGG